MKRNEMTLFSQKIKLQPSEEGKKKKEEKTRGNPPLPPLSSRSIKDQGCRSGDRSGELVVKSSVIFLGNLPSLKPAGSHSSLHQNRNLIITDHFCSLILLDMNDDDDVLCCLHV